MIMLFQKEGEWYFPLIQRPDYDGVHAKQMSFPGGKMDETDPDLIYTGMRELREEIGVEISNDNVIGQLTELYIIASNFNVTPSIAVYPEVPEYIQDEYEVDEIIEVKVGDLMNDKIIRKKPIRISYGINIQAPYFNLNNKVVWGATAMILSEFKTILKPYFIGQG